MTYQFACFVSYKRPPYVNYPQNYVPPQQTKHLWVRFAEEFQRQLDGYLTIGLGAVSDRNLPVGVNYSQELSKSLCRSMFMVALIVPEYFESKWCLAEWNAMVEFEKQRRANNLIFPVIFRGDLHLLEAHIGTREYLDLRSVVGPERQLSNTANAKKIEGIAQKMAAWARRLAEPQIDCCEFKLDVGPDELTPRVAEPSPFGRN